MGLGGFEAVPGDSPRKILIEFSQHNVRVRWTDDTDTDVTTPASLSMTSTYSISFCISMTVSPRL